MGEENHGWVDGSLSERHWHPHWLVQMFKIEIREQTGVQNQRSRNLGAFYEVLVALVIQVLLDSEGWLMGDVFSVTPR